MVQGNPAVIKEIPYKNPEDLLILLEDYLKKLFLTKPVESLIYSKRERQQNGNSF